MKVKINVEKLNNELRKSKAQAAAIEMERVINSDIFKRIFYEVLTRYDYPSGELSEWRYKSIDDIFAHFMSGREDLNPVNDGVMNIDIDDYYTWKNVYGYGYAGTSTIYTNTKYFDVAKLVEIGSNLVHEWTHKIGFDHDFKATSRRNNSLSYLSNLIYELAHAEYYKYIPNNSLDRVIYCKRKWYAPWKKVCWFV